MPDDKKKCMINKCELLSYFCYFEFDQLEDMIEKLPQRSQYHLYAGVKNIIYKGFNIII